MAATVAGIVVAGQAFLTAWNAKTEATARQRREDLHQAGERSMACVRLGIEIANHARAQTEQLRAAAASPEKAARRLLALAQDAACRLGLSAHIGQPAVLFIGDQFRDLLRQTMELWFPQPSPR